MLFVDKGRHHGHPYIRNIQGGEEGDAHEGRVHGGIAGSDRIMGSNRV